MSLNAQTTYYYKLTKKVVNGTTSTSVSGGQYISFNEKVCYESDKKGNQVNSSRLNYKYTDNGIRVYSGCAYWGNNTTFFFTEDQSRLSVRASNGDKYVYERGTPPSGVLTCSLIREKQSGGTSILQPITPIISGGHEGGNAGGNKSAKMPQTQKPQTTKTCGVCYGTGTCNICAGKGWVTVLGMGNDHFCTSCRNHDGKCPSCNGRGSWTE